MSSKNQSEKGAVIIEGVLVMIPTLFVLVFLLSLGFLLYQQWNVQYVADDVAAKISAVYQYSDVDINTGPVSLEQIMGEELYRYGDKAETNLEDLAKTRANDYAKKLLKKTSLAKVKGSEQCLVRCEEDALGRRHIEVTVTGTYRIPFSEGLEVFGMSGERTYSASSVAECVDLIHYMSTAQFVKNAADLSGFSDLPFIDMIDSVLKLVTHAKHKFIDKS